MFFDQAKRAGTSMVVKLRRLCHPAWSTWSFGLELRDTLVFAHVAHANEEAAGVQPARSPPHAEGCPPRALA
eukprot:1588425-Prymnesium_polylepis.1